MLKVAITGNIASGKTAVEKILSDLGYKVADSDKISHKLLDANSTLIINAFKKFDILENNKISRQKLGKIVFNDFNEKCKLENILHPLIKEEIEKFLLINSSEALVFVSVPLLFETGMDKMFDKIILLTVEEQIRLKRLFDRDKITSKDARKIINFQISEQDKINRSDYVIDNNSDLNDLQLKVDKTLKMLKKIKN